MALIWKNSVHTNHQNAIAILQQDVTFCLYICNRSLLFMLNVET